MRRLNATGPTKSTLKLVKDLDAFPKIDESYVETSAGSGGVSILMFLLIGGLMVSEIRSYTNYEVVYEYGVDRNSDSLLHLHVDITVAMPCNAIGADLLDISGKHSVEHDSNLDEIPTVFELSRTQRVHLDQQQAMNKYVRLQYHSMHESIWDLGYDAEIGFPERTEDDQTKKDSCRFRGTLATKKLSGNFHITLGKAVRMFGGGHAHLSIMTGDSQGFNFSHRIHHLSFGDKASGKIYPLDGDENITNESNHLFQYFVKVVPTKVNTKYAKTDTYQFSVTERARVLNHNTGSHGTPGIFFRYEISPIKVYVEQRHKPVWKFFIRLCGIVGGIYACTGILTGLFYLLLDVVCCRLHLGKYKPVSKAGETQSTTSLLQAQPTLATPIDPISFK